MAEAALSAQVGGPTTGLSRIAREAFVASDRPAPSRLATHVTVVPTMLGRILDVLTERDQCTA